MLHVLILFFFKDLQCLDRKTRISQSILLRWGFFGNLCDRTCYFFKSIAWNYAEIPLKDVAVTHLLKLCKNIFFLIHSVKNKSAIIKRAFLFLLFYQNILIISNIRFSIKYICLQSYAYMYAFYLQCKI